MKKIRFAILGLNFLLAFLPAFFAFPVAAAQATGIAEAQSTAIHSLVVSLNSGSAGSVLEHDPAIKNIQPVFAGSTAPQFQNIFKISTSYSAAQLEQLYDSAIAYVQNNNSFNTATTLTNDPGLGVGSTDIDREWGLFKTDFPAAWDITKGSSDVVIAVIDTGIDGTHEDLSAGQVGAGFNFLKNSIIPAGTDSDDNGHGTLIAGIIGATPNNFRGISGADWNATLMPLKALDQSGSGNSADVAAAIVYAADHGANIINMSLGGTGFSNDTTLANAVSYAYNKNVVLIAAAGNDVASTGDNLDNSPVFPICDDNGQNMILGVAATDVNDQKAQFSNYGRSCVDVSAPGKHILSTINFDPVSHAPIPNSYAYGSGTSVAVPFVSAEAALIKSAFPAASNGEIYSRIINSADAIDIYNPTQCAGVSCAGLIGKGRINALAAFNPNLNVGLTDGSLVAAQDTQQIYFISGGQKHPVSGFVLQQRFGSTTPKMVPGYELSALPTGPYAMPEDDTLVKTANSPTVYEILSGLKRPITFQVWQQRRFQPNQINILSDQEMSTWLTGTFLPPVDGTLVRARNAPTVYWVVDGLLHPVNRNFFIQRGLNVFPIILLNGQDLKGYALGNAFIS